MYAWTKQSQSCRSAVSGATQALGDQPEPEDHGAEVRGAAPYFGVAKALGWRLAIVQATLPRTLAPEHFICPSNAASHRRRRERVCPSNTTIRVAWTASVRSPEYCGVGTHNAPPHLQNGLGARSESRACGRARQAVPTGTCRTTWSRARPSPSRPPTHIASTGAARTGSIPSHSLSQHLISSESKATASQQVNWRP